MLVIEVEYLLGRVHAAEFRDNTAPEWPPHPARLFSALVAAHHDSDGTEQEREALLWLERQPAPQISAANAGKPTQVVTFVPTNYAAKNGSTYPEQRSKQPRSFAVQAPASPIAHFVWPEADPSPAMKSELERLLMRVAALGRATSLVRASIIDPDWTESMIQPNFLPDDDGKIVLAVPGNGRLDDLERTFQAGRRPQQGIPARYINRDDLKPSAVPEQGHFGEMVIFRRISGIGFPSESTLMMTRHLRRTFLSHAGGGSELSAALGGHEGDKPASQPHVAFAALPNVGGEYGDGRLLGLAVVLPRMISRADRRIAVRACASIDSINLGAQLGEWKVEIANFDVRQRTLKPETWIGRNDKWATKWVSVTPIQLDRFPKKSNSTEELLVTACIRAGLPTPVRCSYGAQPQAGGGDVQGVAPVFAFRTNRWAVHASFEFSQQVRGPMLIGAGRFFGMGLMKPVYEKQEAASE